MKKKLFISVVAVALVACFAIGGTLAWLTDTTDPVTNTFTVGDINITLDESTGDDYKVIPGTSLAKDPTVTVEANSEKCWLFVKVQEENWQKGISYAMADGWVKVSGTDNVYYYTEPVETNTSAQEFQVLKGNTDFPDGVVSFDGSLTKDDLEKIEAQTPKLIFTAYAVQYMKDNKTSFTAEEAWAEVAPQS